MDIFAVALPVGALMFSAGLFAGSYIGSREYRRIIADKDLLLDFHKGAGEKLADEQATTKALNAIIDDMTPAYLKGLSYQKSQETYLAKKKAKRAAKVPA